jgi:TatD DNase family protein
VNNDIPLNYVDTHCHLNFDVFDQDRDLIIEKAQRLGVTRILIPGTDIETSTSAIECAHKYFAVYAAVGIHPNSGLTWTNNSLNDLRRLTVEKKVVAIGEIGLDYYRRNTPLDVQVNVFKAQLDLALELELPVVIHNRDASEDILDILRDWHGKVIKSSIELAKNPGVLHSFSGNKSLADAVIAMNYRIGITGPVTFNKAQDLQNIVSDIQLDSLLIETDSPFLTPSPYRGMRNEPANVRIIAEKISSIKNISMEKVVEMTTEQSDKLFRWREVS